MYTYKCVKCDKVIDKEKNGQYKHCKKVMERVWKAPNIIIN